MSAESANSSNPLAGDNSSEREKITTPEEKEVSSLLQKLESKGLVVGILGVHVDDEKRRWFLIRNDMEKLLEFVVAIDGISKHSQIELNSKSIGNLAGYGIAPAKKLEDGGVEEIKFVLALQSFSDYLQNEKRLNAVADVVDNLLQFKKGGHLLTDKD